MFRFSSAARVACETNKFQRNSNWRSSVDLWPHDSVEYMRAASEWLFGSLPTIYIHHWASTRPRWMTNRPDEFAIIRFDANSMRCSAISLARSRTSFGQFYSIRSGILMVEFIFRISNINVSAAINRIEPPFLFDLHECLLLDAGQYNDHKLKLTFD